jgi:hypothetical protein
MIRGIAILTVTGFLSAVGAMQTGQPHDDGSQGGVPAGHPPIPLPKPAADWPKAKADDVGSIDAILKAFYEAPAGAPGQARDWDRYRSLFVPDARMIPARPGTEGASGAYYLPVSDYIEANKKYFEKGGFADKEVARRIESFGNIVHVWSTYESRRKADDPAPYIRGINSIQMLKDGDRYWIINVFWDYERPDNAIPEKYLTTPQ